MNSDRIKIFGGSANPQLTAAVCKALGLNVAALKLRRFSDGEINCQILENVRGADCFVIQPTCSPVEFHLMEILCLMDALKRSSAERITAVLPYYGYGRQDRKDKPRVPISAKLVASVLETAGANRIMALDLHAAQIQGFFNVPVDHLFFRPVVIDYYKQQPMADLTVVSPDAGGVERARSIAKRLNAPLAIIDKRREEANVAEVMNVIGDVAGQNCLIIDDLIDTAGTLVKGADALLEHGAASVTACATHAVLSGPAVERIQNSRIKEVVVSNSIPLTQAAIDCGKIRQLCVASLLARAIQSIHEETSVSMLFE
ncbi:MAG: ribose-phosphate pyrophosphokinae [Bryobacterales bacterium]|jgi:ribose-phosphate pyrophosphokinase|nr:ribose-phosphate pyrophosphokinae [Bryobacterales bacterium]